MFEDRVVQQPELLVVDHFVFLSFAYRLDGEPELLFDLVHRLVVEVSDAGVYPQRRLGHAEFVFTGGELVVGESPGKRWFASMTRSQLDGRFTVLIVW